MCTCVCVCVWEEPPPQWDGIVPWWARRRVVGEVPCALRFGVPPLEGSRNGRGGGGGRLKSTGQASLLTGRGGGLRRLPTGGGSR